MPETIELMCFFVMGFTLVAGCLQIAFFMARFVAALIEPLKRWDIDRSVSPPISAEAEWPRLGDDDLRQAA